MSSNLIYAYRKKTEGKIVYVGQTINLKDRHKKHIEYDPFNKNVREYEYPLSRGIRKYGVDEYELIILEDNIDKDKLNEREQYWIQYYDTYWNGYNQTIGGSAPIKPIFTEDKIDKVIEMLKQEEYRYNDIIQKTGISMTHIYNINMGYRRRRNNIEYPIRKSNVKGTKGLKLSQEENIQIHNLLLNTFTSFKDIAKQYSLSPDTISDINAGKTKSYILDGYSYPLRETNIKISTSKTTLNPETVLKIHEELKKGEKTSKDIAEEYGTTSDIVNRINHGRCKAYLIDGYSYPIKIYKIGKLTEKDINNIYKDLKDSNITFYEIAKKFNVTDSTIRSINRGASHKKENIEYPIRKKV